MDLVSLRTMFITLSGRYDLVIDTEDYANNGADFFIQGGQKYLESLILTPKSKAKSLKLIGAGDTTLSLSNCQSVLEVWGRPRTALVSGTLTIGRRYQIVAQLLLDFTADGAANSAVGTVFIATAETLTLTADDSVVRVDYDPADEGFLMHPVDRVNLEIELGEDQSLVDQGEPYYYAVDVNRDVYIAETDPTVRGLVFGPPADQYYTITTVGIFRFDLLEDDSDTNYWSEEHSVLLLYATLYTLESFYRNTAGMRDWLAAIAPILFGIDADKVEEEVHNINEMRG